MTIVRALDSNHDWQFGKGKNDYKKNLDGLAQTIKTRLLSFLGDCFFETSAGIDWFNLLGGKDRIALELAVSTVILNTENVTGIFLLSVTESVTRNITIRYQVQTTFGQVGNEFQYDGNGFT